VRIRHTPTCHKPLAVEYRRIDDLRPYGSNPRVHSRKQIAKLKASIKAFGWTNPIIIDEFGNVICGHGRLQAAAELGMTEVPVISLGAMSEGDRRAYIIADNKLAEESLWSRSLLRSELKGLLDLGYDIELTGFETLEIDTMLSIGDEDDQQEDRVELHDDKALPVCQVGDFWHIGKHRLIVGNACDAAVYERLLGGETAQLVMTDPPYGCVIANNVSGLGKVRHENFVMGAGEQSLPEFAMTLLRPAFKNMARYSAAGAVAFVFMDWRGTPHMLDAAQGVFHEQKNMIVWIKDPGMGSFYRSAHELCHVFKISPGQHINNIGLSGRHRSNVWQYPGANAFRKGRLEDLADHPTIKPKKMIADAIMDCSRHDGIVLDAFCGSGTTLVAAEMTSRRGYGIELDPKYADVILRRVSEACGSEPLLDGSTLFSQVAALRREAEGE
jgi:DNA modification methylase